jgi:hypothetical protein
MATQPRSMRCDMQTSPGAMRAGSCGRSTSSNPPSHRPCAKCCRLLVASRLHTCWCTLFAVGDRPAYSIIGARAEPVIGNLPQGCKTSICYLVLCVPSSTTTFFRRCLCTQIVRVVVYISIRPCISSTCPKTVPLSSLIGQSRLLSILITALAAQLGQPDGPVTLVIQAHTMNMAMLFLGERKCTNQCIRMFIFDFRSLKCSGRASISV